MRPASEYADLTGPGPRRVYRWEAFDPASRVELSASALAVDGNLYFIDPIPLAKAPLDELLAEHVPAGIIVTNANHVRAAEEFRRRYQIPLCLHEDVCAETGLAADLIVPRGGGPMFGGCFEAIPVSGGAGGEMALQWAADGGWMIVGDALINLPSHPFSVLPDKYCADPRVLRHSLAGLLAYPFERMLFAHGEPLMSNAHGRLAGLLEGGKK